MLLAAAARSPEPVMKTGQGVRPLPTLPGSKVAAMLRFLVMRILGAITLLLLLSVVTFAIIQAPPGDYGDYIRAMAVNQGGATFEQADIQAELYREAHGLNDPLVVQYFRWITGIVTRFDFGHSLYYNKPVGNVVAERL